MYTLPPKCRHCFDGLIHAHGASSIELLGETFYQNGFQVMRQNLGCKSSVIMNDKRQHIGRPRNDVRSISIDVNFHNIEQLAGEAQLLGMYL